MLETSAHSAEAGSVYSVDLYASLECSSPLADRLILNGSHGRKIRLRLLNH